MKTSSPVLIYWYKGAKGLYQYDFFCNDLNMDIIGRDKTIKFNIFVDVKIPNYAESLGKWKVWVGLAFLALILTLLKF